MPNVTISLNDKIVEQSRRYAQQHQTSLNGLIRKLLTKTVEQHSKNWLNESYSLMDKAKGNSQGQTWNRADLHR